MAIGIGAALASLSPDVLAIWVVDPLIQLWWLIDSLPQALVWGMIVSLGVLAIGQAWYGLTRREATPPAASSSRPPAPLTELALLIRRAETSPIARRRLAARLSRMAAALRARNERMPVQTALKAIKEGSWPVDLELRAVLDPPRTPRWPLTKRYRQSLERMVAALWEYAKGGHFDAK